MGSLAGHVIPGSFFILYGVWWIIISIWTHLKLKASSGSQSKLSKSAKRDTAVSTYFEFKRGHGLSRKSWLPQPFCTKLPIEPIVKIILTLLGIIVEAFLDVVPNTEGRPHIIVQVFHVYDSEGNYNDLSKLHHITMYFAFMLSGIVDILVLFIRFPRFFSPLFFSLAFWTEGTLFYFHALGRDGFNVNIHFILTTLIFFCVFMSLLRLFYSTILIVNLGLGCGIVLQGSWFIQAGLLLFPPGESIDQDHKLSIDMKAMHASDDHGSSMFAVAFFTWHVLGVAIAVLMVWVALSFALRSNAKHALVGRKVPKLKSHSWMDIEERRELIEEDGKGMEMETISLDVQETAT